MTLTISLEHQFQGSETQYISQFLDKITSFAKRNNVAIHLVAHPRKMGKDQNGGYEVPNLYDINGSANFFNKTDFGICVYRMPDSSISEIHIQKVKFKHMGTPGMVQFMWNKDNGRYAYFDGKDVYSVNHDCANDIEKLMPSEPMTRKLTFYENVDAFLNPIEKTPF